jgi:hypothetical protein
VLNTASACTAPLAGLVSLLVITSTIGLNPVLFLLSPICLLHSISFTECAPSRNKVFFKVFFEMALAFSARF